MKGIMCRCRKVPRLSALMLSSQKSEIKTNDLTWTRALANMSEEVWVEVLHKYEQVGIPVHCQYGADGC